MSEHNLVMAVRKALLLSKEVCYVRLGIVWLQLFVLLIQCIINLNVFAPNETVKKRLELSECSRNVCQ
jgi:hypothetical protein